MASSSDSSFGAKLRKGQDILVSISGFHGYNPPRAEESVAGFTDFINSLISTNATESSLRENYKVAIDLRQAAFTRKIGSVDKLISPIKGAVESQFGKKSSEAASINAIVHKMRATKLIKLPTDPANPLQQTSISKSERSYGSMSQFFNDIINTLNQFSDFNPSNDTLKIATLQNKAVQITTLNDSVMQKIQDLKATRADRIALYAELKDRVQRIKSYVKAQYGNSSTEYNLIKGISV